MNESRFIKAVGELIRIHRTNANLTQLELADKTDMARTTIIAIEQGDKSIRVVELYKIAMVIGLPLHCFMPDHKAYNQLLVIRQNYEQSMADWHEDYADKGEA